jgi:hypothetical protein
LPLSYQSIVDANAYEHYDTYAFTKEAFMRTTLNLPNKLLRDAKKALNAKTKTEAIIRSLEETVRRQKIEQLLALRGKLPLDIDLSRARGRS